MSDQQDVIEVLTHDHREVKELFDHIEQATDSGERRELTAK